MIRLLKRLISGERGQALPIVLVLLVFSGLMVTPSLRYAASTLNHGRVINEALLGNYAAEAGAEDTLWRLRGSLPTLSQLPEAINGMTVTMQTEEKGVYTLYFGSLVEVGGRTEYLQVDGAVAWDAGAAAYKYTATVMWTEGAPTVIHLTEIGVRLPIGYRYQAGSAALFTGNLSLAEPVEEVDSLGASMVNWVLPPPLPSVSRDDPERTQVFYITGDLDQVGNYAWVVSNRQDIGEVSTVTGTLNRIIATATIPATGEVAARVVADVLFSAGITYIVSWQTS